MEFYHEVERAIITTYRKPLWRPFMKAVRDYQLVKENDKIAVCISGGKDSFLLAKCMQELKRHGKVSFDLVFLVMNPGYTEEHLKSIEENAALLNIPIETFESDVFAVSEQLDPLHPCYMCARMRRGCLYAKAKELGCNKIALGHHLDDVLETILLNLFYAGEFKTMMPKLHSTNFEGMELIRPLYLVREKDIITFANHFHLKFLNCACKFSEKVEQDANQSKRHEMKKLIETLSEQNKNVVWNLLKSTENVNLETILKYKDQEGEHSFLDDYEERI